MDADVILIGASVRAAAQSAQRAGLRPWCADLFADADLRAIASATALPFALYPEGFLELLRSAPPGPVMYTGGLENYPDLIDAIATHRTVWGNSGHVLRQVRDPLRLQTVLTAAGFAMPEIQFTPERLPLDGSWLVKPRGGAGGSGIAPWRGQELPQDRAYCWQRFVPGQPRSALYLGDGQAAWCLGWADQLIGQSWLHAKPFSFCGAFGPLPWDGHRAELERLGNILVRSFSLWGVFGVDLMVDGNQHWVLEVNPRYPASAELYEKVFDFSIVGAQQRLCQGGSLADVRVVLPEAAGSRCKAILFAPAAFTCTAQHWQGLQGLALADVPPPGTAIAAGQPVLTVFASHFQEAREHANQVYLTLGLKAAS